MVERELSPLPALTAALLLAACAASPPQGEAPSPPVPDGDDPDLLDPWTTTPEWTPEELEARVQDVIALGFPNPRAPYLAYLSLMARGDAECPGDPTQLVGQEIGFEGCTSASGVHFEGNTTLIETDTDEPTAAQRGYQLGGDFLIEDTDGTVLAGGGTMMSSVIESAEGRRTWSSQAAGTWIHTRRDDWLGRGISATLVASGMSASSPEDRLGLVGTLGLDGVYLQFDVEWPTDCGGHATGEVRVRDPSGAWGTIVLGDACDGCGVWTLPATGESATVCLDLRAYGSSVAELGTW